MNSPQTHPPDNGYYTNVRPEMVDFVPLKRDRVLDIGCGQGIFVSGIEGVREAWGIEPTEAARAAATRLHRVIPRTFDDARDDLPRHYFDVVICNDVIEHMPDHETFLDDIKKYIAPGGVLIGSIPNVRYYVNLFDMLIGKDWEYRNDGTLDRTHLRFFTERSLQRVLGRQGFLIQKFQGINSGIDWHSPYVLKRHKLFGAVALVGSFGYFSDIRHRQFGFRVAPN
jgi:2-polyprenyl-3-methyl-5-hydroxy-6-metoxy-1,4-benzoquinol methylase